MIRLIVIMFVALLLPVVAFAQTSTETATPTLTPTALSNDVISTYNFDLTPESQFDINMSHNDIMRSLGVEQSYQIGVYGDASLEYAGNTQLSEYVPYVPYGRSSATSFISCSDRNGSTPANFKDLDGAAANVISWDWPTYSVCGNLSGSACAAALGDKTTYTYYYSDMGRGSWFTIPYLSFNGAPTGVVAPPSSIYSSTSEWSARLYFENGSVRSPDAGVIPTWQPEQSNPNAIYDLITNIWNPKEIGQIFDTSISGRRWYITNLNADQVGNYAVQFRMPKIYLNTFKPRLSVCAVRPSQYSPSFAATAVANQTAIAATRTVVANDVVSPPAPPAPAAFEYWDNYLNDMWYNGSIYLKCIPLSGKTSLSHCFINLYGAGGSVPTVLRSGVHIKIVEYDPATGKTGADLVKANFVATRGVWSRLTFDFIRDWAKTKGIIFNAYRMLVYVSCPVGGINMICVPSVNGSAFNHMYSKPSDNQKPIRSSSSVLKVLGSYPGGQQAYLTATAYKTKKTPTITRQVMTAIRTITPIATVRTATSISINSTTSAQTATAQKIKNNATATAYFRVVQTANSIASQTSVAATSVRATATARTGATQTNIAVATQYLAATLTAISGEVGTAQATQQAQLDRTATVKVLMDDGDAVIRYNTDVQMQQIEEVSQVGPGSVFSMLVDAATAFDRGLYSSPCNGFPASIGGSNTQAGAYEITDELADSLCEIRIWLDAQTSVIPLVKQILSVIFVILIAVMVMRIIRGSSK